MSIEVPGSDPWENSDPADPNILPAHPETPLPQEPDNTPQGEQ